MSVIDEMLDMVRVKPGKKFRLKDHDAGWQGNKDISKNERKAFAKKLLTEGVAELANAQDLLFAAHTHAILLIFQAMDAAGKDSTIKHVMSGINPQGCQVTSFKQPNSEELEHDFLWRCGKVMPARGYVGIFNRSYYEEVLVVKVHPDFLAKQRLPDAKPNKDFWRARYEDINNFEEHLTRNGTIILKFFLNISKDTQRKRFLDRFNDPAKHWKCSGADMAERQFWDEYMDAYEDCLSATNTKSAPWHVIPADHKWVTRSIVSKIITTTIKGLNLKYPEVTPEMKAQIEAAKQKLEAEGH